MTTSVVADAKQLREDSKNSLTDTAILVVPAATAGATVVAENISRRLDKLNVTLTKAVKEKEKKVAAEKRKATSSASVEKKATAHRSISERLGLKHHTSSSSKSGGGSLFSSVAGGMAGGAMATRALGIVKGASRTLGRLAAPLAIAIGGYEVGTNLYKGEKIGLAGAITAGAGTGAVIGSIFPVVGTAIGSIAGGAVAGIAAATYNVKDIIVAKVKSGTDSFARFHLNLLGSFMSGQDKINSTVSKAATGISSTIGNSLDFVRSKFYGIGSSVAAWTLTQGSKIKTWLSDIASSISDGKSVFGSPQQIAKDWADKLRAWMMPGGNAGSGGGGSVPGYKETPGEPSIYGGNRQPPGSSVNPALNRRRSNPRNWGTPTVKPPDAPPSQGSTNERFTAPPTPGTASSSKPAIQPTPAPPTPRTNNSPALAPSGRSSANSGTAPAPAAVAPGAGGSTGYKPSAPNSTSQNTPGSSKTAGVPNMPAAKTPQEFLGNNYANAPAGMRNNNPGNIKYNASVKWNGLVGPSQNTDQGDPQAVFNHPAAGMRAAAKLAMNKYNNGATTLNDLIAGPNGWTPGHATAPGNIAKTMGIKPTDNLNLNDPAQMRKFLRALITQEHGPANKYYTDDLIKQGVDLARGQSSGDGSPTTPANRGKADATPSPLTGGGGDSVKQIQNGTRRQPISATLKDQLNYAASQAGVKVEVYSGGQAPAGSGGPRTGSTRHDNGNAADLKIYVTDEKGNKRYLDMTNPADMPTIKKFISESVRAGATGVGAAPGYMGSKSFHVGGGSPGTWGAGGAGANAPDWLRDAWSAGRQSPIDLAKWKKENEKAAAGNNVNIPTPKEQVASALKGLKPGQMPSLGAYGALAPGANVASKYADILKYGSDGALKGEDPAGDARRKALGLPELPSKPYKVAVVKEGDIEYHVDSLGRKFPLAIKGKLVDEPKSNTWGPAASSPTAASAPKASAAPTSNPNAAPKAATLANASPAASTSNPNAAPKAATLANASPAASTPTAGSAPNASPAASSPKAASSPSSSSTPAAASSTPTKDSTPAAATPKSVSDKGASGDEWDNSPKKAAPTQNAAPAKANIDKIPIYSPDVNLTVKSMKDK